MGMRQYSHSVTGNSMTSDAQVSPAGQLVRTRGHDNRQYSDRLAVTQPVHPPCTFLEIR